MNTPPKTSGRARADGADDPGARPDAPADTPLNAPQGERIAKRLARAGVCSRREAERLIEEGRVSVDGKRLASPALNVTGTEVIAVDGKPIPALQATRLWRYFKPPGLITTNKDPEGRPTVFERMPEDMPRVVSVGRLDVNTEGLLLLTNDGALARLLELPATGWVRRYRARAHGEVTQADLDRLKKGIEVDGVRYGEIEATLDKVQGSNLWITLALKEGRNREVKRVLGALGLKVNRLIRLSYGPFQIGDLERGQVKEVPARILKDQLGPKAKQFRFDDGRQGASRAASRPPGRAPDKKTTDKSAETSKPSVRGKAPSKAKPGPRERLSTKERPRADRRRKP